MPPKPGNPADRSLSRNPRKECGRVRDKLVGDRLGVSHCPLSLLVLIGVRIGERLSFGRRGLSGPITTLMFAGSYAAWSYFSLHDTLAHGIAMVMPAKQG